PGARGGPGGLELVPPEREVLGELEHRTADEPPVHLARLGVVVHLHGVARATARLGVDVQREVDAVAVRDVHGDPAAVALTHHDRGGQHPAPRVELAVRERHLDLLGARRVDAEGRERRDHRPFVGRVRPAAVPRAGGHDAVGVRERVEPLARFPPLVDHLSILPEAAPSHRGTSRRVPGRYCAPMYSLWLDGFFEGREGLEVPLRILLTLVIGAIVLGIVRTTITQTVRRIDRGRTLLRQRAKRFIARRGKYAPPMTDPLVNARRTLRANTLASVLRSTATIVIILVIVTVVLTILDINLAPLIASAGVVGVALGFGAQTLVKDYLSGIAILIEDQYGIGDVIDLGDVSGTVEEVGLRVTQVRDFNGTLWYMRNGELLRVGNLTQGWSRAIVEVRVDPDENIAKVQDALRLAASRVQEDPELGRVIMGAAEVSGIEDLTADYAMLRILAKTA